MGFKSTWIAVRNVSLEQALEITRLKSTGQARRLGDDGLYAVERPRNWRVIVGSGWESIETLEPSHALTLSKGTEAFHFGCYDTSMTTSLTAFVDGAEVWALVVEGTTPTVTGIPPVELEQALAHGSAFEAAADLGQTMVGFRHDVGDQLPATVLEPAPQPRGLWKRLFGRRQTTT